MFSFQRINNGILSVNSGCITQTLRPVSFKSSPQIDQIDINAQPNVEICQNPPEWKYVEMILGNKIVPEPTKKDEYPSGWKPQTADPKFTRYFIRRTRNHLMPVYLDITYRGTRHMTVIKFVQGDIWALEEDLRRFIENYIGKKIITRVNEFAGFVTLKGDYVNLVKEHLMKKGF